MNAMQTTGLVFNIQKYSLHDGAGLRTLVFLKGCPLRCTWCSNPESQLFKPEHAYNANRCLGAKACGRCLPQCQHDALSLSQDGAILYDATKCTHCAECTQQCPTGGQKLFGEKYTVAEIIQRVEEDEIFYARSGGGMTLSGGEPLAQAKFAIALLQEAHKARIHTTIETCGHYPTSVLAEAYPHLDAIIMDIKSMDSKKHQEHTGYGNERILENVRYLCEQNPEKPILFRTPVIPGFNDTEEDIMAIRNVIPVRPNIRYEILSYHRMGEPKYISLGRPYLLEGARVDETLMAHLRQKLDDYIGE